MPEERTLTSGRSTWMNMGATEREVVTPATCSTVLGAPLWASRKGSVASSATSSTDPHRAPRQDILMPEYTNII